MPVGPTPIEEVPVPDEPLEFEEDNPEVVPDDSPEVVPWDVVPRFCDVFVVPDPVLVLPNPVFVPPELVVGITTVPPPPVPI